MPTRESYQVNGNALADVVARLNFILARISDRLDKIEGIRGDAEIEGELRSGPITVTDSDDETIHSLGAE